MKTPTIVHLVEAALYADDLAAAETFYSQVMGLPMISKEPPRHLFFQAGPSVLLIFDPEETRRPGGYFPPHGTTGQGHLALGIAKEEVEAWIEKLRSADVTIEKRAAWPRGGESIYFRDPAGNLLELITPGCWGLANGW